MPTPTPEDDLLLERDLLDGPAVQRLVKLRLASLPRGSMVAFRLGPDDPIIWRTPTWEVFQAFPLAHWDKEIAAALLRATLEKQLPGLLRRNRIWCRRKGNLHPTNAGRAADDRRRLLEILERAMGLSLSLGPRERKP